MNAVFWLVLACASVCSTAPAFAVSMRTGMSRLDARELRRRQLLIRVLQTRQRAGAAGTDAFGAPGEPGVPAAGGAVRRTP
ncbi:hypothetical protein ACF068_02665 [Streptomyces sp. NPDC016309]|uniref:hypothetical protein n=1 Tax=Streptomyces sp. NPDC016309 TaxID=3364965 RepID=UPI0036FE66AE